MEWSCAGYSFGLVRTVPELSGIYLVAQISRIHGLPLDMQVLYVGRANNLRRRYRSHVDLREQNPALNRLVASGRTDIEFWWAALPDGELDAAERRVIKDLMPVANRVTYGARAFSRSDITPTHRQAPPRKGTRAHAEAERETE